MNHDIPKPIIRTDATPTVMRIVPELAVEIGLNESIMLLQIAHWISISNHLHDGQYWTYQSVRDMHESAFPFWGIATINRTVKALEDAGFIHTGNYNKRKNDKTRWFSLCVEKVQELRSVTVVFVASTKNKKAKEVFQNGTGAFQSGTASNQNGTTLPETTTEITREVKNIAPNGAARPIDPIYDAVKETIFGIDDPAVVAGGRIGKISNWLKGKYQGAKGKEVGLISAPAKVEHIASFAKWYTRQYPDVSLPRDFEKFVEHWREWASSAKPSKTTGADLTALGDSSTWGPEQWAEYNQIMRGAQS